MNEEAVSQWLGHIEGIFDLGLFFTGYFWFIPYFSVKHRNNSGRQNSCTSGRRGI